MASLAVFAQNAVLDALMRGVPIAVPNTWYIALMTTMGATNALAGVEVQGGSYARVPVSATLSAWSGSQGQGSTGVSIGTGGQTSNNATIRFPEPTDNWGAVTGWEVWDAAINGTRWFYDILIVPKTVSVGDPAITFPAGEFQISFV